MPKKNKSKTRVVLPESKCPGCGHLFDAADSVSKKKAHPDPGDIGLCIQCGLPLTYTENLTVRAATLLDLERLRKGDLDAYQTLQELIKFIRKVGHN